jgi:hypothetical protein
MLRLDMHAYVITRPCKETMQSLPDTTVLLPCKTEHCLVYACVEWPVATCMNLHIRGFLGD